MTLVLRVSNLTTYELVDPERIVDTPWSGSHGTRYRGNTTRKAEIVACYREWTAHNIHLVDDAADRHGAVMMIDRDAVLIPSPQGFQCQ